MKFIGRAIVSRFTNAEKSSHPACEIRQFTTYALA